MNRLTSLCYPQYKSFEKSEVVEPDVISLDIGKVDKDVNARQRMKPPLTKIRIGDFIGSNRKEVTGFIKSLSYSIPDESVWEIEVNKQVPKYITVDIGFQIIHSTVPNLDFALKQDMDKQETFYGINQELFNPNRT
jgi:hypothetical protein